MMRGPILDFAFTETSHHAKSHLHWMTILIHGDGSNKGAFIAGSSTSFPFFDAAPIRIVQLNKAR